jgi:hypothetical protein
MFYGFSNLGNALVVSMCQTDLGNLLLPDRAAFAGIALI